MPCRTMTNTRIQALDGLRGARLLAAVFLRATSRGLLRLRLDSDAVRLDCIGPACAKCCRAFNLVHIKPEERDRPALKQVRIIDISGVSFIRGGREGCAELSAGGDCGIYADRPATCRDYPWYKIAGDTYYDAGCPGIGHRAGVRPPTLDIVDIVETTQYRRTIGVMAWLLKKYCTIFK